MEFEGTKRHIFETAVQLFSRQGVEATSMRHIADHVGIRPSSIYNHFESKRELLDLMYQYYEESGPPLWPSLDVADGRIPVSRSLPGERRELLGKILQIAVSQSRSDPAAQALVNHHLVERPKELCCDLLARQTDMERIPQPDREAMKELFACLCYGSSMRAFTAEAVTGENWVHIRDLLRRAIRGS